MNIAITDLRGAAWNTHHAAKKDDPEFKGLVTSVKKQGIIQRVLVRKLSDGSYEIIDGHRRVEAAKATAKAENAAEKSSTQNKTEAGDWESRYRGASRKINELQARIAELEKREADRAMETVDYGAVVKERDGLKAQVAALEQTAPSRGVREPMNDALKLKMKGKINE